MLKKILITSGIILFIIALLIFRPVPIIFEENAIVEKGVVTNIYEGGIKDVVFIIQDKERRYYINRGLENGLDLDELREKLIGQEVILKYPKYWTPLDWNNEIRHLSKVEFNGEVIFNEFKQRNDMISKE